MNNWRNASLMLKAKKKAKYTCQECGSAENIQTHHYKGKDNRKLIVLCGNCHRARHPELDYALFINKKEPHLWQMWLDKAMFNNDVTDRRSWYIWENLMIDKRTNSYYIMDDRGRITTEIDGQSTRICVPIKRRAIRGWQSVMAGLWN